MKVWVTKYALSVGILAIEGRVSADTPGLFVPVKEDGAFQAYFHKPYWHESRESAIEHAKLLADRKCKSLLKSVAKIQKIDWSGTP